jgi:hypothetical protein
MKIQYIEPLSRGISRMKRDLFNPFDLRKWFVIGFTAFLAGLADVESSGLPGSSYRRRPKIDVEDVLYFPQRAWEWFTNHPGWAIAIVIVVFLISVISVALTWLSSRGKFMFLDNVVQGRFRVAEPWNEYRNEGNSFFLWNLSWGIIVLAVLVAYITYCFISLQTLYESSGNSRSLMMPAVLAGLGFLVLTVVSNFVFILLRDFVVPLMYRDRVPASEAVQKFVALFSDQFLYFVGYGLFLMCLLLGIVIGIMVVGCGTCCVGFVILAIPYINAVLLLPVSYALRAFSVEFLEQFGPGYDIFPKPDVNPQSVWTSAV